MEHLIRASLTHMRRVVFIVLSSLCLILGAGGATAQGLVKRAAGGYPDKPVRVVVPVAAGGSTDIIARITVGKLGERLGASFVVDNRPGAGGVLGNEIVANSRPDGYTLLFTYAAHTIVPFMREKFSASGTDTVGSSSQEFAQQIKKELSQNEKVIRAVGMQAD